VTLALTPTAGIARPGLRNVAHACFECFICFVHMFQVLLCGCCKSRSGCCICCNDCTRILQVSIPNVSSVFFHTYVANVFIWLLHMFHTYIVSVLSGCCMCL
jgi:hypothetical protein